jgi:hypothetical protein
MRRRQGRELGGEVQGREQLRKAFEQDREPGGAASTTPTAATNGDGTATTSSATDWNGIIEFGACATFMTEFSRRACELRGSQDCPASPCEYLKGLAFRE